MTEADAASLALGLERIGLELPAPVVARLERFSELLLERAVPLGMVGRGDAGRIVPRHVVDSLRPAPVIAERGGVEVVDVGSGAGLPGIPLAIAMPEARFVLAEPRAKRAALLELAVEVLDLANVDVHAGRAESLEPNRFTTATARAFAPLETTWRVARLLLRPGGIAVVFAGSKETRAEDIPGASSIEILRSRRNPVGAASSASGLLATDGSLVIITAK
ncbi:MAG TPA: 16S rRNA (guanine(527)-N(7))-methyltransferase RsmG [Actinomycetota bacterium]